MMRLLQTATDPDLAAAAERMLAASVLSWEAWERLQIERQPDCILTRSDLDFPFFNNVMFPKLAPATAPDRIAQLIEAVGANERAVCWWVTPSSAPADLGALLEGAGAARVQQDHLMAAELATQPQPRLPAGLEIAEVVTRAQLARWTSVVVPAHGIPAAMGRHWIDAYAAAGFGSADAVNRHFIGTLDGKPVGAATLISAAGLAGLANVATAESVRGRGVGSAMTLWPLAIARLAGYKVCCLSASAAGKAVYDRLGFRSYGEVAVHLWRPPDACPGDGRKQAG